MSYNIKYKNKEVRELQKSEFFINNYKGKLSLKIKKEYSNSSIVTIKINKYYVNEFFGDKMVDSIRKFELTNFMCENNIYPNNKIKELYDKINEITEKGIQYYETGDYGIQPSEYWWFKVEIEE